MLLTAATYVVVSLAVDLAYSLARPRIEVSAVTGKSAAVLRSQAARLRLRPEVGRLPLSWSWSARSRAVTSHPRACAPPTSPRAWLTLRSTICSERTRSATTSSRGSSGAREHRSRSRSSQPALALLVAVPLGLVAGYYRGVVDTVVARATDILLAFPFLILAIGLAAILGPSLETAAIALGAAAVPRGDPNRRGATLASARWISSPPPIAVGASNARVVFRHVLPNLIRARWVTSSDDHDPACDRRRGDAVVPRARYPSA